MRSRWIVPIAVALLGTTQSAFGQSSPATGPGTPNCAAATSVWNNTMLLATQAPTPELRTAYTSQVQALAAQKAAACAASTASSGASAPLTERSADSLLALARTTQDTLAIAMRVAAGDTAITAPGTARPGSLPSTSAASPVVSGAGVVAPGSGYTVGGAAPQAGTQVGTKPAGLTVQTIGSSQGAPVGSTRCGYSVVEYLKALNYAWNTASMVSTKVRLYEEIMFARPEYHEACGGDVTYPRVLRSGEGPGDLPVEADFR